MKKLLLVLASLAMIIGLCACGGGGGLFAKPTPTPIPEIDPHVRDPRTPVTCLTGSFI